MRVRTMGSFALDDGAADRSLGRGRARELLALLCAHRDHPLDTAAIVDALWCDDPPPTAATIVHGAVARIRQAIGTDALLRRDEGYVLDAGMIEVDLWEIEALAATGRLAEARALLVEPFFGPYHDRRWVLAVSSDLQHRLARDAVPGSTVSGPRPGGAPVTRLVGRRKELAALRDAHRRSRLVTVVGLGGVGKSRLVGELAVELGRAVARVDLGLASGSFPARLVAEFGMVATNDDNADLLAVAAVLEARASVLVLDGCEHDVDGAADGVAFLLQRSPGLSILATSRVALGLPGEQVIPLLPFANPDDVLGDGVELVMDRLRALGLPFEKDDRERAAEICVRCAGVPLAIELAAGEVLAGVDVVAASGPPGAAVIAVVSATLASLAPATHTAGRRAALLAAGATPAVLAALPDGPSSAGPARELLATGLVAVEGAGGRRRLRFPDTVRAAFLEAADSTDLQAASDALDALGRRSRPQLDQAPDLAALADAIPEITNVHGLLERLATVERHRERLDLAMAFATPWREDGHWVRGSEELERALGDVEALDGPLDPAYRAEVVLHIVTVAGTYEMASRWADELGRAAHHALDAGLPAVATGLFVQQANGLGYGGRHGEAMVAVDAARSAAEASGSPTVKLFPEVTMSLGKMVAGQADEACRELAATAAICAQLGAHSDAARVGRLAAMAGRRAGDLSAALAQAEIAEEQATLGLARGTLTVVRAELADLLFNLDPTSARDAVASSFESAVATGQLRTLGICRLRLGLLDDDLDAIAAATVELLAVDGRWASLGLAHVLPRLPAGHELRRRIPDAMLTAGAWGAPLGADDERLVRSLSDGAERLPDGWQPSLVEALLGL